jgi:Right handed beta helix region/Putative metal-binding motif
MNMRRLVLVSSILWLFNVWSSQSAFATDYYADPTASCPCEHPDPPVTACGTTETPYSCIQDAVTRAANPGDTVIAKDGVYAQCLRTKWSGNSGARITIRAENVGAATISRPESDPTCDPNDPVVVDFAGNEYNTVRGFLVTGAPGGFGIRLWGAGASHNEIIDIESHGNTYGIGITAGVDNTVTDSVVHTNTGDGLYVGAADVTVTRLEANSNGNGLRLQLGGSGSFTDVTSHDNAGFGAAIYSDDNVLTNAVITGNGQPEGGVYLRGKRNTLTGGEVSYNHRGVYIPEGVGASDNLIQEVDIHHNLNGGGVKIGGDRTTIDRCHIHHNTGSGIFESSANNTISSNEIDNNGRHINLDHGLYMKGRNGRITGNKVHHNGAYGLSLWAAPTGDASHNRYIVERNDVYANRHGIVLGGTEPEGGMPKNVEIRYNLVHHNLDAGFQYRVDCDGDDEGNTVHHNTFHTNGREILLINAASDNVTFKSNLVIGKEPPVPPSDNFLVLAQGSNLSLNALDGNVYYRAGTTPGSEQISWSGNGYSFDEIKETGVRQNATCSITVSDTPENPLTIMDTHSLWSVGTAEVKIVDPTTSHWSTPYLGFLEGERLGDFHLAAGSSQGALGVCCLPPQDSKDPGEALDIDGEMPTSCMPTPDCSAWGTGVGADWNRDSDSDMTPDRYDCSWGSPGNAAVCDGDGYEPASAESICTYPAAAYDDKVFPGADELCDGKDTDCDGEYLESELDVDQDGFFDGCGGDCNDLDKRVYPGALQFCDGKNNRCDDPNWSQADEPDIDQDGNFGCTSICDWRCDCDDEIAAVNVNAPEICNGVDDNCSGVIDEGCCVAGDSGLLDPTAQQADAGHGFDVHPTRTFANDSQYAKDSGVEVDSHRFHGYGVSIPSACQVKGIEVRLDWWTTTTTVANMGVELSWDGGATWTTSKVDDTPTTSQEEATLGSSTDTWGRSWSAAELSDGNLRVRVTTTGQPWHQFFLDWVPVRVTWGP